MDATKKLHSITHAPAYLIVGSLKESISYIEQLLSNLFCTNNSCNRCTTCRLIREHQYHSFLWLQPEKNYTRDSIADIFSIMSLALDSDQPYFFVIQQADLLTTAAANSLLKAVEEPPPGYHFIFLTERPQHLLKTITSRCITCNLFSSSQEIKHAELYAYFTTKISYENSLRFMQALDKIKINETESIELLDTILAYWLKEYNNATTAQQLFPTQMVTALRSSYEHTPMPGSSTLFWKNLFLQTTSIFEN